MTVKLHAAMRLFADSNEAGVALTAIKKILGPHFVTDEDNQEQRILWRSAKLQAELDLTLDDEDMLLFSFRTKGYAGGFDAEGHTAADLFRDIRHQVTEYQPSGRVPSEIATLRRRFATIK